jgi:cytochrome c-type biogenesis protein CcmH/NrfG
MTTTESQASLEARKQELFSALRQLQRDHDDGVIDRTAYEGTRRRYETEAAEVLERLDRLSGQVTPTRVSRAASRRMLMVAVAAAVVAAAIAIFLASALHARTGNAAITGDVGSAPAVTATTASSRIMAAQRAVAVRPRDVNAELQLAGAYLDAGDTRNADRTYQRAARLDPRRPEGPTMHAMLLGSGGHVAKGLTAIRAVERAHPWYAKAWFVDGLLASRTPGGLARAIHAWRVFLTLAPHSSVALEVRALLATAENVQRRGG